MVLGSPASELVADLAETGLGITGEGPTVIRPGIEGNRSDAVHAARRGVRANCAA
jgi:hypothetical protein